MSYRTASKPILKHRGRNRKFRPKTFKTEGSANKWAESQGLKSYALENMRNPDSKVKKIRVVVKG